MPALLYLKHAYNLSDESVCERWTHHVYFQYFCAVAMRISSRACRMIGRIWSDSVKRSARPASRNFRRRRSLSLRT
ncbi:transposase [Burkholderia sp. JSH-S8]|nr:transposase [Burkholderia sp. JSH-S8]